jgi:hypothetical protein
MKILLSLSKDFESYDFATFNGTRALNLSAGARSLTLKKGDVFGYRDGRTAVYVVTPERGLTYEYKITEDDFDKRVAPRADELKPARAKKLFAAQEAPTTRDRAARTGTRLPVLKKEQRPSTPPAAVKEVKETPKEKEEHALVTAYGNPLRFSRIRSNTDAIGYLIEVWNKVNKTKCDNKLLMPSFIVTKDMGAKTSRLGVWYARQHKLGVSPRLLKAQEHVALTTIVHEIAHQAVTDIEKSAPEGNNGHGPLWAKWMYKFGLTPSRYSQFNKMEYFDEDEKKQIEQRQQAAQEKMQNFKAARDKAETRAIRPSNMRLAQWYHPDTKTWIKGMIVCPNDRAGKRWTFIRIGATSSRFDIVPNEWFHELPPTEVSEAQLATLRAEAQRIVAHVERKQDIRSMRRSIRNGMRY